MPKTSAPQVIKEALDCLRSVEAERASQRTPFAMPSVATASSNVKRLRERSAAASDAPTLALNQVSELLTTMAAMQLGVDAATADIANAKTPEERAKAEQRLARLREQMARLAQELENAKKRQLNSVGPRLKV